MGTQSPLTVLHLDPIRGSTTSEHLMTKMSRHQPPQPLAAFVNPTFLKPSIFHSRSSSHGSGVRHPNRNSQITMNWNPSGLMRDAVEMKKLEVSLTEQTLKSRPDHPVNLRRSFFAHRPRHHLSRSLRRRDGTLSIMLAVKRFQAPKPGERAQFVASLEDIPSTLREFYVAGIDSAFFYTDAVRHGVELSELRIAARSLRDPSATPESIELGADTQTKPPLIRHDIIIDPVQIAEAAEAGACAVNIIAAAALPDLLDLLNAATAMGLEAIVECHTPLEVDFAMECGATILFLNNWDRTQHRLVPGTAEKLIEKIPSFVLTIAGGGLVTAGDCWNLLDAGFNGVVLGQTLLQTRRPESFIKEIRSQKRFTGDAFSGDMGIPFSEGLDG